MSMQQILTALRSLDEVLELAPDENSEYPPMAWGDHFFYWSPDGTVPRTQPFATITTKDYPDDEGSALDPEGRWRVNIHVGRERSTQLIGEEFVDPATADVVLPHPLYARQGWVCVVVPAQRTADLVLALLAQAHVDQRRRLSKHLDTATPIREDPVL